MNKSQSFGFDTLLIIFGLIIFGQILFFYVLRTDSTNLNHKIIENNQVVYLMLEYNNSLSLFDDYFCNNNLDSFEEFNETINHFLESYLINRLYFLNIDGIIYSKENISHICLKNAIPSMFNITSSCDKFINLEFSIYSLEEKEEC